MTLLRMDVDPRDLARAPALVARAWIRAGNRAVAKTTRSTLSQALRAIAKAEGIPVSRLRKAKRGTFRLTRQRNAVSGLVWLGLLPVKASVFGKPRQTRGGARAGKQVFPEAFVATMPSGHTGIFERAIGRLSRFTKGRRGSSPNLPIVEQLVSLRSAEAVLNSMQSQVQTQLEKTMAQELNFELVKATRGV